MLTPKQEQKYWRTWAKILACQGWSHEPAARKDVRRKATHIMCGLKNEDGTARSMKSFGNRDFSRWLAATAHLCDEVDTRDRDRENSVWTIERLAAAFETLLGHDYARALKIDWRDTEDLDKFPVEDPLRYMRDENGKIDQRDAGRMRDLQNLRNTLKNRLGRVIQRIKDGQLEPGPRCPNFYDRSQEDIIQCLVGSKPITPRGMASIPAPQESPAAPAQPRRQYILDGGKTFNGTGGGMVNPPQRVHAPVISAGSSPARSHQFEEECPMPPRQRKPATVTGPIPVAPPTRPLSYCMHGIKPPTAAPAPARGLPADIIIDEVAHVADPENEPF